MTTSRQFTSGKPSNEGCWHAVVMVTLLLLGLFVGCDSFILTGPEPHSAKYAQKVFQREPESRSRGFPLKARGDDPRDPIFDLEKGEEKDPFVFQNVVVMEKINKAISTTAYAFLIIGFLLNGLGYDFTVRDGKLTVDTLEKRQFENEVNRVVKSDAKVRGEVDTSSAPK